MNETVYIYTLSDPRDGRVRYVGATRNPKKRLCTHKANAKRCNSAPVQKWINLLLDEGLEPIMNIVDSGNDDTWSDKEKYWIQQHNDDGCDLTNYVEGGKGQGRLPKRQVSQYTKEGKFIHNWDGARIAGRELEIDHSHITKCCKYKMKSVGGYIWRYADDPISQTEQPRLFQDEDK